MPGRQRLANVQEVGGDVAALLELADLVGQAALSLVVVQEPRRSLALQDGVDPSEQLRAALVGNLGLDDEGRLVFPHKFSSRSPRPHRDRALVLGQIHRGW